jgi:replicative DNA helicase
MMMSLLHRKEPIGTVELGFEGERTRFSNLV